MMIHRYCQAKEDQIRLSGRWPWYSVYFTNQHTTLITAPRLTHPFHAGHHHPCSGLLTSPGLLQQQFCLSVHLGHCLCQLALLLKTFHQLLSALPYGLLAWLPPPCQPSARGEMVEVLERGNLKKGSPCFKSLSNVHTITMCMNNLRNGKYHREQLEERYMFEEMAFRTPVAFKQVGN